MQSGGYPINLLPTLFAIPVLLHKPQTFGNHGLQGGIDCTLRPSSTKKQFVAWILLVFNQSVFLSKEPEHIGIITQPFHQIVTAFT